MFKLIKCGKHYEINNVQAPYFPMLVNIELDSNEAALYEVNSYLRSFAIDEKGVNRAKRIAATLCRFFNYHYYKRIRSVGSTVVSYTITDESTIQQYQKWLKINSDLDKPSSRNTEIKYIYHFYWYLEKTIGFITGVIGIPDGAKGLRYNLPVRKAAPKQKTDFLIPILETEVANPVNPDSTYNDWQNAYLKASKSTDPLSRRDALMIRVIMDTALRREELNTLTTNLFEARPTIDCKNMYVTLNRSKLDDTKGQRIAPFPVELYRKIKQYNKTHRRKLKKSNVQDEKALFLSCRGLPLGLTSVNFILNKYGLKPHDGRKISLTELFIERIKIGTTKETAIQEVAEIAGHSPKSKGSTLEQHYIIASNILESRKLRDSKIKAEDVKDEKIQKLQLEIEALRKQVSELST